jgi:hypothetical protein
LRAQGGPSCGRKVAQALSAAGALIAAVGLLAGCGAAAPRVVIQNDTASPMHVFYCNNRPCTEGVSGNDVVLSPGKSAMDFWNSPDSVGPVGIATSPGDLLVGCLADPSPGQDRPGTRTLRLSTSRRCPGQSGQSKIRLVQP